MRGLVGYPVAAVGSVALGYFLVAKVGLALAVVNESATAVWLPTGVAIASIILLGLRAWPGVWLGAFLANVTTTGHAASSLFVATGNTLEALAGGFLVLRLASGAKAFDTVGDFFRFVAFAGVLATMVSASIGLATLLAFGLAETANAATIWTTWWLGGMMGALIAGPAIVLWFRPDAWREWQSFSALREAWLLIAATGLAAYLAFGPRPAFGTENSPVTFLFTPIAVWAGLRLGPGTVSTLSIILAPVAVLGTLNGHGPFATADENTSLLLVQSFLAVLAVSGLATAALARERSAAYDRVYELNRGLKKRIGAAEEWPELPAPAADRAPAPAGASTSGTDASAHDRRPRA